MKRFIIVCAACLLIFANALAVAIAAPPKFDTPYIGNSYRMTCHKRNCPSVWQMWEEHQVPLESVEEALAKGYHPCGNCKPWSQGRN